MPDSGWRAEQQDEQVQPLPLSDRELAERDAAAPPRCAIWLQFLKADEDKTALQCGHASHSECIKNYAESRDDPIERSCPFKCATPEVLVVDEEEGELARQRASLPSGLLTQAEVAEAAAAAAFD